jgi:RNA polymerase sigma-70 factor, ECF subfamily
MSGSSVRDPSSTELLGRLRTGDATAYRVLAEQHLKPILNYCMRILANTAEAEDVTQETFVELWQNPPRAEATPKLSTWLYRVAHNRAIDRLRRRRETTDVDELSSDSARPSRMLERRHTVEAVQRAIAGLSIRQRGALCMAHYDGMSNAEIAEVLGVSVDATESLLSRARRTLRQELHAEAEDP